MLEIYSMWCLCVFQRLLSQVLRTWSRMCRQQVCSTEAVLYMWIRWYGKDLRHETDMYAINKHTFTIICVVHQSTESTISLFASSTVWHYTYIQIIQYYSTYSCYYLGSKERLVFIKQLSISCCFMEMYAVAWNNHRPLTLKVKQRTTSRFMHRP